VANKLSSILVIGVVKNFHTASLQHGLEPVVLLPFNYFFDAGIKISPANAAATIKNIEEARQEQFPEYLFQCTFLDDYVGRLYREVERMFRLFEIFAGIAIFIGCLGLFGLTVFMVNQKTKEIGVRKVLGASVENILFLFSREFVRLILVAFMLAAPVGWYFSTKYLEQFAYKISIGPSVFVLGLGSTFLIAFVTVGYRSIKAAMINPALALRSE